MMWRITLWSSSGWLTSLAKQDENAFSASNMQDLAALVVLLAPFIPHYQITQLFLPDGGADAPFVKVFIVNALGIVVSCLLLPITLPIAVILGVPSVLYVQLTS